MATRTVNGPSMRSRGMYGEIGNGHIGPPWRTHRDRVTDPGVATGEERTHRATVRSPRQERSDPEAAHLAGQPGIADGLRSPLWTPVPQTGLVKELPAVRITDPVITVTRT